MRTQRSLWILSVLGLINHLYLLNVHLQVHYAVNAEKSMCNLGSGFNCEAVAASPYSSFFGVPLALAGAMVQLVILYFLSRGKLFPETHQASQQNINMVSVFAALTSVVMAVISFQFIGNWCLFCIAAYILSWAQMGFSLSYSKNEKIPLFNFQSMDLYKATVVAILLAFATSYALNKNYGGRIHEFAVDNATAWTQNPAYEFDLNLGLKKEATAPVKMTIVEFADFRCSHCRAAVRPLHAFIDSRPNVEFIFKTFPLDGVCNSALPQKGDGASCVLAAAVLCAQDMNQSGWKFHEDIFDRQMALGTRGTSEEVLKELSAKHGLDWEKLKVCTEDAGTLDKIQKMSEEGKKAQIQGTPSIFVNGKKLERGQSLQVLEEAYKRL